MLPRCLLRKLQKSIRAENGEGITRNAWSDSQPAPYPEVGRSSRVRHIGAAPPLPAKARAQRLRRYQKTLLFPQHNLIRRKHARRDEQQLDVFRFMLGPT